MGASRRLRFHIIFLGCDTVQSICERDPSHEITIVHTGSGVTGKCVDFLSQRSIDYVFLSCDFNWDFHDFMGIWARFEFGFSVCLCSCSSSQGIPLGQRAKGARVLGCFGRVPPRLLHKLHSNGTMHRYYIATALITYLTPGDLVDTSSIEAVGGIKSHGLHMIRDKAASNCLPRFRPSPHPRLQMLGVSFCTSFNLTPWSGSRFDTCNTLFERHLSIVNPVVHILHCYCSIYPRSSIRSQGEWTGSII